MHPLVKKIADKNPSTISVWVNGVQVIRIVDRALVIRRKADKNVRLLTIHLDDNPEPEYAIVR
jgi:hypothetical protein